MFSENVNCDLNTTASECKETKVALIKHCTHKECGGTFHLKLSKRKKKKATLFANIKFRDFRYLGKIAKFCTCDRIMLVKIKNAKFNTRHIQIRHTILKFKLLLLILSLPLYIKKN